MSRPLSLLCPVLTAVALTLPAAAAAGPAPQDAPATSPTGSARPNLVLVLVDDLGWRDHGLPERPGFGPAEGAGQARFRTPHLARLAESGLVFTDGYASAPVCTPTRTSIQTGTSPGQSHITYWTQHAGKDTSRAHPRLTPPAWRTDGLDAGEVTLAKLLRDAGYRTIHVGKAHFGAKGSPAEDPAAVGFTRNVAGHAAGAPGSFLGEHGYAASLRQGRAYSPAYWDVPGLEAYWTEGARRAIHGDGEADDEEAAHEGREDAFDPELAGAWLTDALAREAVREIEEAVAAGEPFFLNFAPYAVHTPIMADPARVDGYPDLDPQEAAYATMIEGVDDALGAIVAKLEELGITDETALVYTSDNGGLSALARGRMPDDTGRHHHNAPLLSGKGSAYEGGTRVPWVARWPGMDPLLVGAVSRQVVVSHDLFPTFLGLAGVAIPDDHAPRVEGEDLVALTATELARGEPVDRTLFWHQPHQWGASGPGIEPFTSVRSGDHKAILFHDGPRLEVYDLARDIGEREVVTTGLSEAWPTLLVTLLQDWASARGVQSSTVTATGATLWPVATPGPTVPLEQVVPDARRAGRPDPNLLLIVVDDLGWTDVSSAALAGGHPSALHRTPHTDRLADTGLVFGRSYAAAPNCAPSRAALLTGLWAARTGVWTVGKPNRGKAEHRALEAAPNETTLAPRFRTLAERLPAHEASSTRTGPTGYRTIHLGKWHLGGGRGVEEQPGGPLDHGFDVNLGGDARGNPGGVQRADDAGRFDLPGLATARAPFQWIDDRLGDELVLALEHHASPALWKDEQDGLPFFAHLSLYAVHTPVRPTDEDRAAFEGVEVPEGAHHDDLDYAAYVMGYDDVVGQVLATLEGLDDPRWPGHKLVENTIVVLTSDNGGFGGYEASGVPGLETYGAGPTDNWPLRGGKGQLLEGGIRVPLVIRWDAGLPLDGESGEALRARARGLLVSGVDLAPTLLGLAEVGDRTGMDGRDLSGVLRGRRSKHADQLFWHFPAYLEAGRKGMRTGPASLVRSEDFALHVHYDDRRVELYRDVDLATVTPGTPLADLPERRDLAADPAHRARAERMLHALATWLDETDAAMPTDPATAAPIPLPSVADLPPLAEEAR